MKTTRKIKHLKPELHPHIGCANCGCGEMKRSPEVILCNLSAVMYNGFGGWRITRNSELVFEGDPQGEWNDFPTLRKFELMARKNPGDWMANCMLPLREAYYQRQGLNRWVLVKTGIGFA